MKENPLATTVEIEDMLEKIDLGMDQIRTMLLAEDYDSSANNYELKYYIRITLDGFYLLQNMVGTSPYGDI